MHVPHGFRFWPMSANKIVSIKSVYWYNNTVPKGTCYIEPLGFRYLPGKA